jgi:hypothetical protein
MNSEVKELPINSFDAFALLFDDDTPQTIIVSIRVEVDLISLRLILGLSKTGG